MKSKSRQGQSLVETTFVLAAFMGLLLGMVAVGQTLFVQQTLADRAHQAARWGAVNPYDPAAIRNIVLFGAPEPKKDAAPIAGLSASAVQVGTPGCPGPHCRVSVAIAGHGVRSVEPVETPPTGDAPAKP
ncbi:MAG TPA: TadE family protein [Bryobacteraceae bacterium]|nr:TadE family protein [Bryobacteraceae bacterium]